MSIKQSTHSTEQHVEEGGATSSSASQPHEPQQDKAPISPDHPLPVSPDASRFSRKAKQTSSSASTSTSTSSASKDGKAVRFKESVVARPSLHKNNYSSEELANCWYSPEEFDIIRDDVMKTLELMRTGNLVEPEDDDDCTNGSIFSDDCTVATNESNSMHSRRHSMQSQSSNESFRGNRTIIYNSNRNWEIYDSTSRGLENYTFKGYLKASVRKLREKAVWAVMEEQDLQVDQAVSLKMNYLWYDDEAIRGVYSKHSKVAMQVALLLGSADCRQKQTEAISGSLITKIPSKPRRHSMIHNVPKKNIRKFFTKSSSEDELIKKAAASFSSEPFTTKKSKSPFKQQRRSSWFTSRSKSALPLKPPNVAAALVA